MRVMKVAVGIASSLLALVSTHGQSQTRTYQISSASCARCRIIADSVGYLGFSEDTVTIESNAVPAHDSRGRFYAMGSLPQAIAYLFDSTGRLTRSFARQGEGPGEFGGAVFQIRTGRSDSVYYFQRTRVLVFDANQNFARSIPLPAASSARNPSAVLSNGTLVRSVGLHSVAVVPGNATIAAPATTVRLGGADTLNCSYCGARNISAAAESNAIWSSPGNEYSLEQHDITGRLLTRIVRTADWFPKWIPPQPTAGAADGLSQLKRARILSIQPDGEGLVWMSVYAPDLEVPIPASFNLQSFGQADAQAAFFDRHFASYVDVIDPRTGTLMASHKFKNLLYIIAPGFGAAVAQDSVGGNGFQIFRLRMAR